MSDSKTTVKSGGEMLFDRFYDYHYGLWERIEHKELWEEKSRLHLAEMKARDTTEVFTVLVEPNESTTVSVFSTPEAATAFQAEVDAAGFTWQMDTVDVDDPWVARQVIAEEES